MYFVFIDEAGVPGFTAGKTPDGYFTLGAMVVKGDNILNMERSLRGVKKAFEIYHDEEFKWSGKYSKIGIAFEDYCKLRGAMFSLIDDHAEIIIASVLDKKGSYGKHYINSHTDLYQQALYFIMERLHLWLESNRTSEPVVFVIDSRKNNKQEDLDENLATAYRKAKRTGTGSYDYSGFRIFSETPYFAASSSSAGLQLADYCAGPIHQYFSSGRDEWYQRLRPNLRKSTGGKVNGYGVKTFPFYATIPL